MSRSSSYMQQTFNKDCFMSFWFVAVTSCWFTNYSLWPFSPSRVVEVYKLTNVKNKLIFYFRVSSLCLVFLYDLLTVSFRNSQADNYNKNLPQQQSAFVNPVRLVAGNCTSQNRTETRLPSFKVIWKFMSFSCTVVYL